MLPRLLLAASLLAAPVLPQDLIITNINIVDVLQGKVLPKRNLLIRNGKIDKISKSPITLPKDTQTLNAPGKYLIPALWDMHAHFQSPARDFNLFLANGVLGARNMGGIAADLYQWRDEINAGRLDGPRIFACGPIVDGPAPTNPPISVSVSDPESARRTVRTLKQQGADFIKVHDGVPRDAYFEIARAASELNNHRLKAVGVSCD